MTCPGPDTYGLLEGLWEAHWPWSRTNRDLEYFARRHGRATRVIHVECWLIPGLFGYSFDIEICLGRENA